MVERHGIAWHEKTLGQLFCDGSARQIVAMLLEECEKGGVELRLSTEIGDITYSDGKFHTAGATAPQLVIATGGPSIPKMGATGRAYDIARQFGLDVISPRPALVPFTLGPDEMLFRTMSGVSVPASARVGEVSFDEAVLFTHKGLSGPAILQVSSYWNPGDPVFLNLAPDAVDWLRDARKRMPRAHLKAALAERFPARLAEALAGRIGLATEFANLSNADLDLAAEFLTNLTFRPSGTEGYAKAEVTAGGISTEGPFVQNYGGAGGPRPLRHRRGGRCHRRAWRLQLSVGMVVGRRSRSGHCRAPAIMLSSQPNTGGEHGRVGGNFDQVDPRHGIGLRRVPAGIPLRCRPFPHAPRRIVRRRRNPG